MGDQIQEPGSQDGKDFKAGNNQYGLLKAQPKASAPSIDVVPVPEVDAVPEKPLERGDIESLRDRAGELTGINDVQRGLEALIIGAGLQTMADRYGANSLLHALQSADPRPTTVAELAATLAPDKTQRQSLYAAIEETPMDALGSQLNEKVGGVSSFIGNDTENLELYRKYELVAIKQGKPTDAANLVFTGDFDSLLNNHPQIVENFRETNDTLILLKDIRAVYESEYNQFTADLDRAKAAVEELVVKGEVSAAELQALSTEIYTDDLARLEERLKAASSPDAQAMIQSMLDRRTAEAQVAREELANTRTTIRPKIVSDLGAENLYRWHVAPPVQTEPIVAVGLD